MKKTILTISIILAFILMPAAVFAGDVTNDNPNAACTITDQNGKELVLEYDFFTAAFSNFPKHGDRINVFLDGNTNKTPDEVFSYQSGDKVFKNANGETVEWEVSDVQYGKSSLQMRVYKGVFPPYYSYGYIYNIKFTPKFTLKRAPIKSAVYKPSSMTVYAEDIKEKAYDGSWFYNFRNRAKHSTGSKSWVSAYEEGDSIEVTLQDNSRLTFTNKIVWTDKGYNDRFVSSSGEIVVAKTNDVKLTEGNNRVEVYLMNIPGNNTMYVNAVLKMGSCPASNPTAPSNTNSNAKTKTTAKSTAITIPAAKNVSAKRSGKKLLVKWKALTKTQRVICNKVQIQYGTNKKFLKAKTVSISSGKTKYVTKNLKKGKYYVRIRNMRKAGKKTYYSKWSAVKTVKIR